MNKKQFNKLAAVKFKHFSRKGYALFSVCGREVIVGVLAVATLNHAKADGVSTETAITADSLSREEQKLDEVIVTGSRAPLTELQTARIVAVVTRDDISRAATASINDILKLVPGVDVRQRGGFGVQTDISVRGGNFDQITILLNGVNISSPHTGHLSADFPLSPDDIERIEVLEGGHENSLCGVVNIITRSVRQLSCKNTDTTTDKQKPSVVSALAHLQGGAYGFFIGNGSVGFSRQKQGAVCGDAMISAGYSRSDGATPNSAFSATHFFFNGGINYNNISLTAQLGYSYKPYEANTFYGASSADQWESNERLMGAARLSKCFRKGERAVGEISIQAYGNRWYDHYQWHRDNPLGENFHKVDAAGINLVGWFETVIGKTSVGADLRHEAIWSTNLGQPQPQDKWQSTGGHDAQADIFYKRHDSRRLYDIHLNHEVLLRRWTFSLALTADYTALTRWSFLPAVNIAFRPTDTWKIIASWNTALRQPTFTDLYYSGTNIEGNSQLKAERTSDLQIGARKTGRGFTAELTAFYSHKTDMIDWVTHLDSQTAECDGVFRSVNFRMDNWGGEANITLLPPEWTTRKMPLRKVGVRYAYISESSKYDVQVVQSKYALEYLRHKIVVNADINIWRHLNLGLLWRYQHRTGNNNPPYHILDARLSWDAKRWSIHIDATNILNREYYDFTHVRQPGIVVVAGVKFQL